MRFSIIIPLFNKEKFIITTIESVLAQSYENFELLIIDDHSSDKSFELVKSRIKDTRVKLLQTDVNSGPGAARNVGLKNCKGDVICFLDADDQYDSEYLTNLYETYKDHKDCAIVISSRCFLSNKENYPEIGKIKRELEDKRDGVYKIKDIVGLLKIEVLLGGNGTVSVLKRLCEGSFFNEKEFNFEDWAYFLPLVLNNRDKVYFNENVVFFYNDLQECTLSSRKIIDVEHIETPFFLKILKNEFDEPDLYKRLFTFWIYSLLTRTNFKNRYPILLKFKQELINSIGFNQFILKIIYRLLVP